MSSHCGLGLSWCLYHEIRWICRVLIIWKLYIHRSHLWQMIMCSVLSSSIWSATSSNSACLILSSCEVPIPKTIYQYGEALTYDRTWINRLHWLLFHLESSRAALRKETSAYGAALPKARKLLLRKEVQQSSCARIVRPFPRFLDHEPYFSS